MRINKSDYQIQLNSKVNLGDLETNPFKEISKDILKDLTKNEVEKIDNFQNILYAENRRALLVILQGMDASGKDSTIKAIMTGVNPQGVHVTSFKKPSTLELDHDYLWRHYLALPERGKIGIFNRSHYENVLITKVHPEFLLAENLHNVHKIEDVTEDFWNKRYEQIKEFEETISQNGIKIIKFKLHISKKEQKERFIKRIENKEKNWKFSSLDILERKFWDKYQSAFEIALSKTSTEDCPWFVIPFDNKAFGQYCMASIIAQTLEEMNPQFPELDFEEEAKLKTCLEELKNE